MKIKLKVTYDKTADAAYVYLTDSINTKVEKTYCCDPQEVNGMINLDFDADGKILGIEILDASKFLDNKMIRKVLGID